MLKNIAYTVLLIAGLIPATFLLLLGISCMQYLTISQLYQTDLSYYFAILSGLAGYIGIITSLVSQSKTRLNFILLFTGLVGFSFFMSLEGGFHGWKWFLTIQEPDEWLLMGLPFIAMLSGLIVNLVRIKNWRKKRGE